MKKRFVIWTFVLVAFACLSVFLWRYQQMPTGAGRVTDKDLEKTARRLIGANGFPAPAAITPIDLKRPLRLAIGGLGCGNEEQNRQLEDLVLADLTGAPGLELIERQSLDMVLHELNMSLSGLVRAKDAVRVGKLLKADWFLLGTGANINNTNFLVVRLVDSRTGIMREADVFSMDGSPMKLASKIAGFVRQCRQDAAAPKPRVYLAIGTFRDVSLNNRQATFPTQLHAYLTAAYQGANVTLLEREAANVLFREVRLDLAGLAGSDGTNPPQPLQAAYWFVDGDYQSYETTNFQVEVALRINRMFGRISMQTLRGPPNGRLFARIKDAIDKRMRQDRSPIPLSLANEASAQMEAGKELVGFRSGMISDKIIMSSGGYGVLDQQEFTRHRRNAEEAIQAFKTVLLLEPTNREAKMCLAACLSFPVIGHLDEARNIYREILEESVQDQWDYVAEQALVISFLWSDPSEKARWFAAAVQDNTNSALGEFYRQNFESATRDATIENGGTAAVNQARKRLLEVIRSNKNFLDGKLGTEDEDFGMSDFLSAFRNKASAAKALVALLPKLESQFPELAPQLTAAALSDQVDTNSPVVAEYQKQLEWCLAHTNHFYHPERFWDLARGSALGWLFTHHQYALALETMKDYRATAGQNFGDEDKIALGFAYLKAKRWKKALEIFASFGEMPVLMTDDGPWGHRYQPVLTSGAADYCREKLGLPVMRDPREFDMGKTRMALCNCSAFAIDETGLWVATGNELLHLDMDLRPNFTTVLPKDGDTPITTLNIGTDNIWIGTRGDGLIEFNKASQQCQRLTVRNGLMMNEIWNTCLTGSRLWIGYGYKSESGWSSFNPDGGIGFLNLLTHRFVSFTPPLNEKIGQNIYGTPANQPPRLAVAAIAAGNADDIWFLTEDGRLRRYQSQSNIWSEFPKVANGRCFATDGEHLYTGEFDYIIGSRRSGPFGVNVVNLRDGQCHPLNISGPFPSGSVSALAMDGDSLWVGGMGYIALIDPKQNQVKRYAFVPARFVDKIQIGGGFIWVQYNGYLHRVPLGAF